MSMIRAVFRKRFVRVSAGASALALAVLASDAGVAMATTCQHCSSDRRLKRDIRAI